jgi:hypothetical protein
MSGRGLLLMMCQASVRGLVCQRFLRRLRRFNRAVGGGFLRLPCLWLAFALV